MKILHINVSRTVGGGLVNHVDNLMAKQIEHGHSVSCFSSGGHDLFFLPYLRKRKIKKISGVDVFELKNSPNKPLKQRGRPLFEIQNGKIEKAFDRVLGDVRPDVVHIHDLQGLCASIIDIAKEKGYPLVYTFHNYWPACPEVELFDYTGKNCLDYEHGFKCVNCNYSPPSYYLKLFLSSLLKPLTDSSFYRKFRNISSPPVTATTAYPSKEDKAAQYVLRRRSFIEAINRCDALIAISKRVKEIYSSYGAKEKKIKVINNPLFLKNVTTDELKMQRVRKEKESPRLNFCYRGGIIRNKGVDVLIDAFSDIDASKADLYIYGHQEKDYAQDLIRKSPKNVHYAGSYEIGDMPKILKDIDVGIIPSVWEECFGNVGLEYLVFGIPIIGSRIGGITDYLKDNVNGLLFEAGDRRDLIDKINILIDNRDLLEVLRKNTDTSYKTLDDLYIEMDEIYRSII